MRGMDLYYQYLNAGFRLPLTAGSDKMGEEIPVGSNRHYIYIQGETTVKVHVEAKSLLPFGRLEIIVNGNVVAWEILPDYWKKRDIYSLDLEVDVTLSESTWIAGRVTSQNTPGMLPRNLTVFAHSKLKNQ